MRIAGGGIKLDITGNSMAHPACAGKRSDRLAKVKKSATPTPQGLAGAFQDIFFRSKWELYVDTFEKEVAIDLGIVKAKIEAIDAELNATRVLRSKALQELGI